MFNFPPEYIEIKAACGAGSGRRIMVNMGKALVRMWGSVHTMSVGARR